MDGLAVTTIAIMDEDESRDSLFPVGFVVGDVVGEVWEFVSCKLKDVIDSLPHAIRKREVSHALNNQPDLI